VVTLPEEIKSMEELMRWGEQVDRKLLSIASKPQIAKLVIKFGMTGNPLAATNSLHEHYLFLLRSGLPSKITLRVLSNPKWFRRSLELREGKASQKEIFWTLTDRGRLVVRGSSPVFGEAVPWIFNKIVDLFKESILSAKIWSGITALLLVPLSVTSFLRMWHGEHFLINSLLGIICFFGANGFAYNLYPADLFDENAQPQIAKGLLLFFAFWLVAALGYGILGTVRMISHS